MGISFCEVVMDYELALLASCVSLHTASGMEIFCMPEGIRVYPRYRGYPKTGGTL